MDIEYEIRWLYLFQQIYDKGRNQMIFCRNMLTNDKVLYLYLNLKSR